MMCTCGHSWKDHRQDVPEYMLYCVRCFCNSFTLETRPWVEPPEIETKDQADVEEFGTDITILYGKPLPPGLINDPGND